MLKVFKWVGALVASVILFAAVAGFVLHSKGSSASSQTYAAINPIDSLPVDSTLVARGEHLSHILACRSCHGDDLSGSIVVDAPPFLVVAPNLTPAGGPFSAKSLDTATRFGINRDGTAIMPMMPSRTYSNLSGSDASALVAYILSLRPIESDLPDSELRPLGRIIVGAGGIDLAAEVSDEVSTEPRPEIASNAAYGRYLVSTTCVACHGADLKGSPAHDPSAPANPDISMAGDWPFELFDNATRRGIGTDGDPLHEMMPSKHFSKMTDLEAEAIHAYLKTL